ncbi:MAG: tRNA 2-selenouridine(34) synthase MnmH [Rubrivivax sp.]|nr:tRNA 2-selenouridine(34) synthase MnmH [Rubrivivax sp.]
MNPVVQPAAEATAALAQFDAVIDARSPAEFAEDHLPGAVNWPVLDDDERRIVGTLYVQDSALAARKLGAALAARRIADHLDRWMADKPREWRPLVYCWRGGQRSGSLAWFLSQIGFRTTQLGGGYKGFRAVVRGELESLPTGLGFSVLCGRTGSGKTRLLQALAARGAQVLDLEGLACHRGSILGAVPGQPQPTQKRFDTLLWERLQRFDPARPVFVESESARIGALRVPEALLQRMRASGRCLRVQLDDAARVQLLLQEYGFFAGEAERFCQLLEGLVELRGHALVATWQALARADRWAEVFAALMHEHYDPLYERSMQRSYPQLAAADIVALNDGGDADMARAAAVVEALAAPASPQLNPLPAEA